MLSFLHLLSKVFIHVFLTVNLVYCKKVTLPNCIYMPKILFPICKNIKSHTVSHWHTIYSFASNQLFFTSFVCIYIYVYVCVCVCLLSSAFVCPNSRMLCENILSHNIFHLYIYANPNNVNSATIQPNCFSYVI